MQRKTFLSIGTAFLALSGKAFATGGLDVGGPVALHSVRILLATGTSIEMPQQIDTWSFRWRERSYRGAFNLIPLSDGRSALINTLTLDAYLYGVVSKEVSASWPQAALQAQAIVARTYALGRLKPLAPYDVVGSQSDQVYGGIAAEAVESREAVDATAGVILTYDGVPAKVAYSSCCGGHTASASDVWDTPYPYLNGVVDPYCANSPNFHWQQTVTREDIARALPSASGNCGELTEIALRDLDAGGRPRTIALLGNHASASVASAAFRTALGPSRIKSTLIETANLDRASGVVSLSGRGYGHGVGFCQWGARAMAAQGMQGRDIVSYYFPGTAFGTG